MSDRNLIHFAQHFVSMVGVCEFSAFRGFELVDIMHAYSVIECCPLDRLRECNNYRIYMLKQTIFSPVKQVKQVNVCPLETGLV